MRDIKIFLIGLVISLLASRNNQNFSNTASKNQIIQKQIDTVFVTQNLDSISNSEYYITERLPDWLVASNVLNQLTIKKNYKIENRLNALYLEEDFNGDGDFDVIVPIYEINSNKKGFAIIHGKTHDIYILGAGTYFKNALGDNQDYIDIWKINRNKENEPSLEEETGNGTNGLLILKNPSIYISKSELGGGQIYWNGKEYVYFHQTC